MDPSPQALTIFDIPGCTFNRTSLIISGSIKYEHWERLGEILRSVEGSIQFWIGDWVRFGETRWGEKYAQAIKTTGLDYQTIADCVSVANRVDFSLRHENLSFSHHRAVAGLEPKPQMEWLDKAEKEQLPYRELRRQIEQAERLEKFHLVNAVLEKIWERIQDGCYTTESIMTCSECRKDIFGLDIEEIRLYLQQLVGSGKAEWRPQGGETDVARGSPTMLCVPVGTPGGNNYIGYRPKIDYSDESIS